MTRGFSNNENNPAKTPVNPAILIAAVVFVVALIGGLAYYFLFPHSAPVTPRPLTESESYLQTKARESEGDFNRLSPTDQRELIQKLGPSAPVTLRMSYQALQSK
ncbi:MAG: hypothetical protein SFU56_14410 [Capsulimonadales bacterium]|nr:hypothetical protein [Capsulimonadales bacterium]